MDKIKIAVIDTGLRAKGYEYWFKENSNEQLQVIGWGVTTQKAAALLKKKPDCVLYNPWGGFITDPTRALITQHWGDYTGLCYGIDYLDTIHCLSPKTKVLICTDDLDFQFVLDQGNVFENFSGYLHYSDANIIAAIEQTMQDEIVTGDVLDYHYPNLQGVESFDTICQQTDLLALAAHQRRSPKQIYYFLLFGMEILKVRSFSEYKEYLLSKGIYKIKNIKKTNKNEEI